VDRETQLVATAMGGLAPIVVAGALVGLRGEVQPSTIALLLMVVVVAVAAMGGRGAGAVAAVTAALAFDFFHTRPYLSLSIVSSEDAETAALLLVAGLIVGTVAGRRHTAHRSAEASRSEIRRIHRLAELVAAGEDPIDVVSACQAELTALLDLQSCHFEAPPFDISLPRLERSGGISGASTRRYVEGGFDLPSEGVELPVLSRGQRVGRFVLNPTPAVGVSLEQQVVAVALADQVGAALAATPLGQA
jgi:hypothetical protein